MLEYLSVLRIRRPRVSSINGAMVGTQAAIMTEFDSMLCVLVSSVFCIRGRGGLVIGYWGKRYLVQINRSAVASAY